MPKSSGRETRQSLRDEAARRLREPSARPRSTPPANVLRELEVQEIALEMQREELHRAQAALEEARELYSEVFHFALVGYLILSSAGLIHDANLNGASLLGVERTLLIGRPFLTFLGQEDRDRWNVIFPTALRRGEWLSFRLVLRRNDGSALHARLACEGLGTRDGRPVVRVVVTDIGELVRAEQALQDGEDRLNEALDEFQDGYWDWHAEGTRTIISRQLRSMLGLPGAGDEALRSFGMAWRSGIHPEDLPQVEATFSEVRTGRRQNFEIECRWLPAGGPWKWLRAKGRIATADGRGRAVRVKGTVSDVTEARHLQESYQRLESLTVALREAFAGGIAEVETAIAGRIVKIKARPAKDPEGRVVRGVATVQCSELAGFDGRKP